MINWMDGFTHWLLAGLVLLFAFSFGRCWNSVYEHVAWRHAGQARKRSGP